MTLTARSPTELIAEARTILKAHQESELTTRENACSLVMGGLDSLRRGLIMYHELGLSTKEIYADLKAAGWGKSLPTLRRYQAELRKDGLIEAHVNSRPGNRSAIKGDRDSVENSQPSEPAIDTEVLPPEEEMHYPTGMDNMFVQEEQSTTTPTETNVRQLAAVQPGGSDPHFAGHILPLSDDPAILADYNRIHRLFDEVFSLADNHAFDRAGGNFSPEMWRSLQALGQGLVNLASAQRNYKPGSQRSAKAARR